MFRKTLCVPVVLAFAVQATGQNAQPPKFNMPEVVRNRAEQQRWLDRKAAWEAAQAEKDNTLYLTEQQVRELRFDKRVSSVGGFDQEILEAKPADANVLRIRPLRQGATAIDVVDEDGNSRHYAVLVAGDTRQIELTLRRHFPDAKIRIDEVQDAVILSGEVADPVQIEQAVEVAEQFYPRVLNWLKAASGAEPQRGNQPAATDQPATADADPDAADAPAFKPAENSPPDDDADLRKVISEIRSLRTVIQDVRSDVMKLRFALRLQEQAEVENATPPEGFQSATEKIQIPASQSWLFDRGRSIARIAIADPSILDVVQFSPKQASFVGRKTGKTTASIWFDHEDQPVMMTVEVIGSVNVQLTPQQTETYHAIERALDERVQLEFENTPLVEILRAINDQARINLVIDDAGLEEEGFTTRTERTVHLSNITLRSALSILLDDMNLGWVIENEALKITSKTRLKGKLIAQAYQVLDLAGSDDGKDQQLQRLVELITATIAPDSWSEVGGQGTIQVFPGGSSLVVRQTEDVHRQIQVLLQSLSRLLITQTQSTRKTVSSTVEPFQKTFPVRTVDQLQMEDVPGRGKEPVVVLPHRQRSFVVTQQPTPDGVNPNLPPELTTRRPNGKPLEVGSGPGKPTVVGNLPRVDAKGGVYVENARPANTIKAEVRNYSPSSELLQKFRADNDFDAGAAKKLGEHIRQSINPGSWDADSVQVTTDKSGTIQLVINHTPGTHDRVRRLLERLEAEAKANSPGF